MTLNLLYLAHDLSDPAIRRRVMMLKAGGARIAVAGFQRDANLLAGDPEVPVVTIGRTADGRLGQRLSSVLKARLSLRRQLAGLPRPDVILARNLEMLALAGQAASVFGGGRVPIVYEALDIHRLMLDDGIKGRLLRAAEGYLARNSRLLATSSPAFVQHYFERRSSVRLPVLLLENKVLDLNPDPGLWPPIPRPGRQGEPWRIGWFGAIRCRKSFDILSRFAREMDGQVEIIIRGRVSPREFPNFDALLADAPHVSFGGSYRNPEDLATIYGEVQFVWAIDFFEEGLNSEWLLPNRLYEGALHGAVPIALSTTETGHFLAQRNLGLLLASVDPQSLQERFKQLSSDDYLQLFARLADSKRSQWAIGEAECRALVARLAGLAPHVAPAAALHIPSPQQSEG
ncbi:glycosyltransferase [Rhizobium sp. 0TCS1.26]